MVDSRYCLDRVVPEGMSQVARQLEVGNHKRRTLNTRLSSGSSAGTFAVSAGPYINYSNVVNFFFEGFRSTLIQTLNKLNLFGGFRSTLKGGPEPSSSEDLCLVNVSVKYFSKLCFGTIQIQPELKYLKPILEDFTS